MRASLLALVLLGCVADPTFEPDADLGVESSSLSSISCAERGDTGYVRGAATGITVVTVDGKAVERETANAYYVMAEAASRAGVEIRIVSGFRTMAQQEYLYHCYTSCSCNSCNLAARPGYSNHQSGHALDLNTSSSGVLSWLNANAGRFGFSRTVPSEPWHWEWWGGGPGGGPCGRRCTPHCEGSRIVGADCGDGDCAVFGATCVDDAIGVRCASVFCPPRGRTKVCIDDSVIATCDDGGISTGDCGAFGAYCSEAGASEARCVSVFCVANPSEVPRAHDVCLPDGRLARCNASGGLENARACDAGSSCQADGGGAACERGGASPRGWLDRVECDGVRGWAVDDDDLEAAIRTHVYFDGPPGAETATGVSLAADVHRDDLCEAVGSCAHGYRMDLPYALYDGADHEVRAYGINVHAGGNRELSGSPKTVSCAAPEIDGVRRHIPDPESLGAWGLSPFRDAPPVDLAEAAALPEGPPLPAAPRLVRDASSDELWMLDGAAKRFVDEPAARGWRLDVDAAEAMDADALAAIPEGPAWRRRPLMVGEVDGPALYVLDDAPLPEEAAEDPTAEIPTEAPDPETPGTPETPTPGTSLSGGCAVGAGSSSAAWWLLAALGLVARLRRR